MQAMIKTAWQVIKELTILVSLLVAIGSVVVLFSFVMMLVLDL